MSSDWDEDLQEQERKNQELEDKKDNDRKTPQTDPKSSSVGTFTPQPSKSTIKQATNPVHHQKWKIKIWHSCYITTTQKQKTLEDIN